MTANNVLPFRRKRPPGRKPLIEICDGSPPPDGHRGASARVSISVEKVVAEINRQLEGRKTNPPGPRRPKP